MWPVKFLMDELVDEGVVASADSDGQTYYWLADSGSPNE